MVEEPLLKHLYRMGHAGCHSRTRRVPPRCGAHLTDRPASRLSRDVCKRLGTSRASYGGECHASNSSSCVRAGTGWQFSNSRTARRRCLSGPRNGASPSISKHHLVKKGRRTFPRRLTSTRPPPQRAMPGAQQLLANAYRHGRGVPQDKTWSAVWYLTARIMCVANDFPLESRGFAADLSPGDWAHVVEIAETIFLVRLLAQGLRPDCGEYYDGETWTGTVLP